MSWHIDDGWPFYRCVICGDELPFIAARHADALCAGCWMRCFTEMRRERRRDFGPLFGVFLTVAWAVIFFAAVLWLIGVI